MERESGVGQEQSSAINGNPSPDSDRSSSAHVRWAKNLEGVMDDHEGMSLFKQFLCETRREDHLIDFWYACVGFKKLVLKAPEQIYEKYIAPRCNHFDGILSDTTLRTIANRMNAHPRVIDQSIFDDSFRELQLYLRDRHMDFVNSEMYNRYSGIKKVRQVLSASLPSGPGGSRSDQRIERNRDSTSHPQDIPITEYPKSRSGQKQAKADMALRRAVKLKLARERAASLKECFVSLSVQGSDHRAAVDKFSSGELLRQGQYDESADSILDDHISRVPDLMDAPTSGYLTGSSLVGARQRSAMEGHPRRLEPVSNSSCNTDGASLHQEILICMHFPNDTPYLIPFRGRQITLKQFKALLPRKGNFRHFFVCTVVDEFGARRLIQREVVDDRAVLPFYHHNRIIARMSTDELSLSTLSPNSFHVFL